MKILIVCSGNADNFNFQIHQAFIYEQIESVKRKFNIEYDTFFINGKGVRGYLSNIPILRKKIQKYAPDIIHAHFGLSGFIAVLQRTVPVVVSFHGSDAYLAKIRLFSRVAAFLSGFNIFVSDKIKNIIKVNRSFSIVPCGVNLDAFYPTDNKIAREQLGLEQDKMYLLFSSSFNNSVKNYPLAFSAIEQINVNCELLELKDRTRAEVNLLLNASNILLLTSTSEGSPQIIKEAMACNCPIVATEVGDISEVIDKTEGCYITSFHPSDVAEKITLALEFNKRTNGREKIKEFDNCIIAEKIFDIYQKLIKNKY